MTSGRTPLLGKLYWVLFWPCALLFGFGGTAALGWMAYLQNFHHQRFEAVDYVLGCLPVTGALWASLAAFWARERGRQLSDTLDPETDRLARRRLRFLAYFPLWGIPCFALLLGVVAHQVERFRERASFEAESEAKMASMIENAKLQLGERLLEQPCEPPDRIQACSDGSYLLMVTFHMKNGPFYFGTLECPRQIRLRDPYNTDLVLEATLVSELPQGDIPKEITLIFRTPPLPPRTRVLKLGPVPCQIHGYYGFCTEESFYGYECVTLFYALHPEKEAPDKSP